MSTLTLKYGMKIRMKVNPIAYILAPGFGITSSSKEVDADFVIAKYWETDKDPNKAYKIRLEPIDQTGLIPIEKRYVTDFMSSIKRGHVQIIAE